MSASTHALFAACPLGLEYLLVDELKALGADDAHEARAGVHFSGDLELAYRAVLWSRLSSRITLSLDKGPVASDEDLYQLGRRIDWARHLPPRSSIDIVAHTRHPVLKNSRYLAQRLRDAISDSIRDSGRVRPELDREKPGLRVVVFCSPKEATIGVDLVGLNLSQRGYRTEAGEAPLREDLASALLLRAGWPALAEAGGGLADPLCGSGTLVIEAVRMAADVAPGLGRPDWTSQWTGHDRPLWESLLSEARQRAARGMAGLSPIYYGSDHDGGVIRAARANAERAGVAEFVRFEKRQLREWTRPPQLPASGLVITNPPYGERMRDSASLFDLYRILGERLKSHWAGWNAAVFTADTELAHAVAMKPVKRYKLRNGPLECLLVDFGPVRGRDGEDLQRPLGPGAEMLANRLKKNLKRLRKYLNKNEITCFRAYDADLPDYNCAIDVYGKRLHVQEYRAPADIPEATTRRRRSEAVRVAGQLLDCPAEDISVKIRERQRGAEQYQPQDRSGRAFTVVEGGLKFEVDLESYLDTGLFLDHRQTRGMIRDMAAGARFLNLFCYTGSVTVYAAAGGAKSTVSVDLSNTYLDWAHRNLALNDLDGERHQFLREDCLAWIEKHRDEYDLIFVDPPTFSNSKRMERHFDIQADHGPLLRACLNRLAPSGKLVFSNNFKKFELNIDEFSDCDIEEITHQTVPPDFARSHPHRCWVITPRPGESPPSPWDKARKTRSA